MRRYTAISQRPENFTLDLQNDLGRGLVFAGLGACGGTARYNDSSGLGNHGTLNGMAIPATATSGWQWDSYLRRMVLGFDGSNDSVDLGANAGNYGAGDLTVSCWAKWLGSGVQVMMGKIKPDNSGNSWWMGVNTNVTLALNAYLMTCGVPPSGWFHVLGTRKGTYASSYLNGIPGSSTYTTSDVNTTGKCSFGKFGEHSSGFNWAGQACDPLMWNRALSLSEIRVLADPSNVMLGGLILPPRRRIFGAVTAGADTYTGNGSLSTKKPTVAGAGTHTIPSYSGVGAPSTNKAAVSGAGTNTKPTYSGAGTLTAKKATISASGANTAPTYSSSVALSTKKATASGTGSHTIPSYSGSGSLTAKKPITSGTGTHTVPSYSGVGSLATKLVTLSGSGLFTTVLYQGSGALSTRKPTVAGSGTYSTLNTGSGSLLTRKPTMSGSGTYRDAGGASPLLYLLLTS